MREVDTVARIGGDEFAVIQVNLSSIDDTEALCRRVIERMAASFDLLDNQVFVGISIGVALAPADALDRIELVAAETRQERALLIYAALCAADEAKRRLNRMRLSI